MNILNNLDKWEEKISYTPQKPYFFDDHIIKNIAIGINNDKINFKKIDKCLEIVNLKRKIYTLKNKHKATIGEVGKKFSGG